MAAGLISIKLQLNKVVNQANQEINHVFDE